MRQRVVVRREGYRDGQRRRADVEGDLNRNRTIAVEALHDHRRAAQRHGFRQAQFQYTEQQK